MYVHTIYFNKKVLQSRTVLGYFLKEILSKHVYLVIVDDEDDGGEEEEMMSGRVMECACIHKLYTYVSKGYDDDEVEQKTCHAYSYKT